MPTTKRDDPREESINKYIKVDDNTGVDYRDRNRSRQCPDMECAYLNADTLPNYAIVLDSFSEKDMKHIED